MRGALLLLLVLAGCGVPPAPPIPEGAGGGGDDRDSADTCGTCTLLDCVDEPIDEVRDELDCEQAAADLGCEDWEWDGC